MNYERGGRLIPDTPHGERLVVWKPRRGGGGGGGAACGANTHLAGALPVTQVSGSLKSERR